MDAHVAQHIFTSCIQQLLADKTRVLVTHHVKFLLDADLVVVLDGGVVRESGRGRDIVPVYLEREEAHSKRTRGSLFSTSQDIKLIDDEIVTDDDTDGRAAVVNNDMLQRLNEQEELKRDEEEKEHGVINSTVYSFYTKSAGVFLCCLVILSLALMQGIRTVRFVFTLLFHVRSCEVCASMNVMLDLLPGKCHI